MKLNAAAEMEPITWPEFARQHLFAPASDSPGLRTVIADLERWLTGLTGYDAISLQPNAGSQGSTPVCSRSRITMPPKVTHIATCA